MITPSPRYEVTLCKECITWATEEKRIFLRQALEARLIGLYYDTGNYQVCLLNLENFENILNRTSANSKL